MTKDELEKLKQTIAYFGHWYDVIGEERVLILEKSIEYITDLEKKLKHAEENCINKTCVVFKDKEDCVAQLLELEKKISILLSCKNCPNNKGGLLCQKEYEDKCLAQKIQYIKELQEEIAELKEILKIVIDEWKENRWILQSEKEIKMIESLLERAEQFLKENK